MNEYETTSPPRFAQRLLSWCTHPRYRENVLGDLHEEYVARYDLSRTDAQRWYVSQAVRSLPIFLKDRWNHHAVHRLGTLLFACLVTLVAVNLWDLHIARVLAQSLATSTAAPSLLIVRVAYFATFVTGAALIGALVAALTFRVEISFRSNILRSLGPAYIILTGLLLAPVLMQQHYSLLAYFGLRSLLLGVTLVLGAFVYVRFRNWYPG